MPSIDPAVVTRLQNLVPTTGECFDPAAFLSEMNLLVVTPMIECLNGYEARLDALEDIITECCPGVGVDPDYTFCNSYEQPFGTSGPVFDITPEFTGDVQLCGSTVTAIYRLCVFSAPQPPDEAVDITGTVSATVNLLCNGNQVSSTSIVHPTNFNTGNGLDTCFEGGIDVSHTAMSGCVYTIEFGNAVASAPQVQVTGDSAFNTVCITGNCS